MDLSVLIDLLEKSDALLSSLCCRAPNLRCCHLCAMWRGIANFCTLHT